MKSRSLQHFLSLGTLAFSTLAFTALPLRAVNTGASATAGIFISPSDHTLTTGEKVPIVLTFHTPSTPNDAGIIGIKAVLALSPAQAFEVTTTDITTPLATPWQYVHRDITTSGDITTITIEAVHFQAGVTGYTQAQATPQTLATISVTALQPEPIQASLLPASEIRAKNGNTDILTSTLTDTTYSVTGESIASQHAPVSRGLIGWIQDRITDLLKLFRRP